MTIIRNYEHASRAFARLATQVGYSSLADVVSKHDPTVRTQYVQFGDAKAPNMLVVLAGTHGVEGFLGSAIMRAFMNQGFRLPTQTSILLIHGVNAWGMKHGRRVTAENVDLNRNFHPSFDSMPSNEGFNDLSFVLHPKDWSERMAHATMKLLRQEMKRVGRPAFMKAVMSGQYYSPSSIFYGGQAHTEAKKCFLSQLPLMTRPERLAVLDIHTGLGEWAEVELICPWGQDSVELSRATSWYNEYSVRSPLVGESVAEMVNGDMLTAIAKMFPKAEVTAAAAEFGTYEMARVIQAIIGENYAHHNLKPTELAYRAAKADLLEVFSPLAREWWETCIPIGTRLIQMALTGLSRR